jgi:hypothetical protein
MISNIFSKNNDPQELEVVEILKELCKQYDIPAFTQNVQVEKGVIPHSRPVLTLNVRVTEPRLLLSTLIHEQLHWHAQEHVGYNDCIAYLKTKYQDDGEHNKSGTYPNSYWEHVIVCFNTRNYLQSILSKEDVDWLYEQWQAYPTLEKLVVEKKEEIQADLEKFDIILLK